MIHVDEAVERATSPGSQRVSLIGGPDRSVVSRADEGGVVIATNGNPLLPVLTATVDPMATTQFCCAMVAFAALAAAVASTQTPANDANVIEALNFSMKTSA